MEVIIEENKETVINRLLIILENIATSCLETQNVFNIGVSGGSLVDFLVIILTKIKSDVSKWRFFFCDERVVPFDDPESTYGVYKRKLIDSGSTKLTVDQFVTIKQGAEVDEAARIYQDDVRRHVGGQPFPVFDILLLGMGPDGHTCSLFPGHKLLDEDQKLVAAISDSPKPPPCRVTLTFPVINSAKNCVFAIAGKEKANMVKRILVDKEDLPAGRVKPTSGKLFWILDKEAGVHAKSN